MSNNESIAADKPAGKDLRLVFGASGYIGSNLVPKLLSRDLAVRAVSRQMQALKSRHWKNVELVEADALEPDTLKQALLHVDTAYYLVHSMAAGKNFSSIDLKAAASRRCLTCEPHWGHTVWECQ